MSSEFNPNITPTLQYHLKLVDEQLKKTQSSDSRALSKVFSDALKYCENNSQQLEIFSSWTVKNKTRIQDSFQKTSTSPNKDEINEIDVLWKKLFKGSSCPPFLQQCMSKLESLITKSEKQDADYQEIEKTILTLFDTAVETNNLEHLNSWFQLNNQSIKTLCKERKIFASVGLSNPSPTHEDILIRHIWDVTGEPAMAAPPSLETRLKKIETLLELMEKEPNPDIETRKEMLSHLTELTNSLDFANHNARRVSWAEQHSNRLLSLFFNNKLFPPPPDEQEKVDLTWNRTKWMLGINRDNINNTLKPKGVNQLSTTLGAVSGTVLPVIPAVKDAALGKTIEFVGAGATLGGAASIPNIAANLIAPDPGSKMWSSVLSLGSAGTFMIFPPAGIILSGVNLLMSSYARYIHSNDAYAAFPWLAAQEKVPEPALFHPGTWQNPLAARKFNRPFSKEALEKKRKTASRLNIVVSQQDPMPMEVISENSLKRDHEETESNTAEIETQRQTLEEKVKKAKTKKAKETAQKNLNEFNLNHPPPTKK